MPDMPKLREIISTFTPEELELSVPIYVQDVTITDYPKVNEYNRLLSIQDYQGAYSYRTANPELEKYILDAKKINALIVYIMNAYEFSKMEKNASHTSYDSSKNKLKATNVQDAIDKLETEVPHTPQEIGIAAITAYGNSGLIKLTNDVKTEIPLTKTVADSDPYPYYLVEENGISIYEPGWYLISASAYMKSDKTTGRVSRAVFVVDEKGNEILSSTENTYSNSTETYGAVSTATKLINITWDDMNDTSDRYRLNLYVRSKGATGHVDSENNSTFLTVARIGSHTYVDQSLSLRK